MGWRPPVMTGAIVLQAEEKRRQALTAASKEEEAMTDPAVLADMYAWVGRDTNRQITIGVPDIGTHRFLRFIYWPDDIGLDAAVNVRFDFTPDSLAECWERAKAWLQEEGAL